jgi:hypothetical protein
MHRWDGESFPRCQFIPSTVSKNFISPPKNFANLNFFFDLVSYTMLPFNSHPSAQLDFYETIDRILDEISNESDTLWTTYCKTEISGRGCKSIENIQFSGSLTSSPKRWRCSHVKHWSAYTSSCALGCGPGVCKIESLVDIFPTLFNKVRFNHVFSFLVHSLAVLKDGDAVMSSTGQHTLAIVSSDEKYFTIKECGFYFQCYNTSMQN